MKKSIVILSVLFFCGQLSAQGGFMKGYDFDVSSFGFWNVMNIKDTLYLNGHQWNSEDTLQEVFIVKMDTFGNVLDKYVYQDPQGSHLALNEAYPIIECSDGGILFTGDILNRGSDFVYKINTNGEIIFRKELTFAYPRIRSSLPREILELKDGYLLFSRTRVRNYKDDIKVEKINFQGELIWEKIYGQYEVSEQFGSVYFDSPNQIVIGAKRESGPSPKGQSNVPCHRNWIFAIDSMGEIQWEWTSEERCENDFVRGLQRTEDGGWLYTSLQPEYYTKHLWGGAPKLVKRDSQMNLEWEEVIAESYQQDYSRFRDILPTPDGNYVSAGTLILPTPYYGFHNWFSYRSICLYKFTPSGDSIWQLCDTLNIKPGAGSYTVGGMVTLPSGSTILAGSFFKKGGSGYQGYVMKVDKHGCIDEGCRVTSVEEDIYSSEVEISLYPNPAENHLQISTNVVIGSVSIYSLQGKLQKRLQDFSHPHQIDISNLGPGIYFLTIEGEFGSLTRKLVVQ